VLQFDPSTGVCTKGLGSEQDCGCDTNSSAVDFAHVVFMASEATMASSRFAASLCRTIGFEDALFRARSRWAAFDNAYAGWPSGVTLSWPAWSWARIEVPGKPGCYKTGYCADYDPRRRPWYGLAAAGVLDVAVVLDSSVVMGQLSRFAKAKAAARSLVGMLSSGMSFAQVVVYGGPGTPVRSLDSLLIRADDDGVTSLQAFIEAQLPESTTPESGGSSSANATGALETAYSILRLSRSSAVPKRASSFCRSAIVMLSATADKTLVSRAAELSALWKTEFGDTADVPRIFVYSYGTDSSARSAHKKLACAYRGLWKPMDDRESDHSGIALDFIEYFSAGNYESAPRWAPPYTDASGLGRVITASKACRWDMSVPAKLLSVVATDFVITAWPEFTDALIANLTTESAKCSAFVLTDSDLESLRGAYRCNTGEHAAVLGISITLAILVIAGTTAGLLHSMRPLWGNEVDRRIRRALALQRALIASQHTNSSAANVSPLEPPTEDALSLLHETH